MGALCQTIRGLTFSDLYQMDAREVDELLLIDSVQRAYFAANVKKET